MKPIFIPSKGRAGKSALLQEMNDSTYIPEGGVYVFAEPQDWKQYTEAYPKLRVICIGEDDKGLSFVRNYMLAYAKLKLVTSHFWCIDDDVKLFAVDPYGKMTKANFWMLELCEEEIIKGGYAQGSLEYRQYAWSNPSKKTIDGYCDCVVLNNTEALEGIFFDENLQLKIDRDFTMQVIRAGMHTLRIATMAFDCPKNGSNEGGLHNVYKEKLEESNCLKMVDKWGQMICTKILKEDGRHDIKIHWNNINQLSLL